MLRWVVRVAIALSVSKAEGIQPTGGLSSCKPFRALFFWHTSSGEDESFYQQRRLIIHLLEKIPNGTAIYLGTVDTSVKSLIYFIKDSAKTARHWMDIIGLHKPGHSGNHIIPYKQLSDTVKDFLGQVGEQGIAEEIILLVNKKSVFDNEDKVKEVLKHRLTIIVFTGRKPVPAIWTDLAIDKEHLVILNDSIDGNVTVVSESIMILFCKDSRIRCDTDEYWNGKRCFRCSLDSKDPSENCLQECPWECQIDYCQHCITAKECSVCELGRFGQKCENNCRGSDSTCSLCKDSFLIKTVLKSEVDCFGCLRQEYFSNGECRHCPHACASCVDEKVCNECNDGYFGNDCSKVCPENCQKCSSQDLCTSCKDGRSGVVCQCSSNCLQVGKKDAWCSINGTCLKGCVNGKSGIGCTADCPKPENCLKCDQFNESCLQCSDGLYGNLSYCDKTCGHCKPNSNGYIECDVDTGECKDTCVDGFFGRRCDQKCAKCLPDENGVVNCDNYTGNCRNDCVNGFVGSRCDIKCKHCVYNTTSPVTCGTEPDECKEVPCIDGFYGLFCDEECSRNCFDPSTNSNKCDKISGNCTSGCFHGWYGETCEKTCSTACFNRSCDQQLGNCDYGCVSGSYGAMCQHKCSDTCEKGVCDRQTSHCSFGCEAGFVGAFCNDTKSKEEAYLRSPVLIGIISSVAGIIALFVCVLITWFLARLALRGKRNCNINKLITETEPVYDDIHESEMETSFTEDGFNKKDDPLNKNTQSSNSRLYYESSIYDIPIERDSTSLDDSAVTPSFDYSTSGIYGSTFERVSIGLDNTDVGPSSDCTSGQNCMS